MRKVFALVTIILISLALFAAYSGELYPVQQYVMRDPDLSDELYIFVLPMRNLEFFIPHVEMFELAGKILGVKTRVMGPSGYDVPAEIQAMETAIAMKPAGIIIYPPGPELGPVINKAVDAGIPVVTVVGDVPESKRLTFVGINQYEVGVVGGEYLAKLLNGKGKVAILSITAPMFQERAQGYIDTFKKYPGIKDSGRRRYSS